MDTNVESLKAMISDVNQFLVDLDKVLPGKVTEELLVFLKVVIDNEWLVDLLLNSISNSKQLTPMAMKRK